jgi:hypothetical protein
MRCLHTETGHRLPKRWYMLKSDLDSCTFVPKYRPLTVTIVPAVFGGTSEGVNRDTTAALWANAFETTIDSDLTNKFDNLGFFVYPNLVLQ